VWSEVIISGKNPPDKNYGSRSELVFASVLWLLGKDVEPGHVLSIITHPDLGISGHVLDNPSPLKYGRRQVERGLTVLELSRGGWPVVNEEGFPVSNLPENIRYAFGQIGVDAQRNRFTQADEVTGYQLDGRDLNEIADILCSVFSRELKFVAGPAAIKRELLAIAHEHPYHPVIDYLDGLDWDGTPRIDHWLANYCNAEDTELNGEFGSKLLVAGVRRIKQPGVKFDTMLVLEGSQGAGKSQMAALLAVRSEWFCGSLDLKSDDKTKAEMLARAWIVECQELDGLNKTTSQNLKKFLSTPTDTYRRAYGRDSNEYRRHCIILGTTNEVAYLRDLTGNRRIWPVEVAEIDLVGFAADVNQLWAEAVVREKEGGSIVLSEHLWDAARELQTGRMVEDDFANVLTDFLEGRVGKVSMDSLKLLLGLQSTRRSHNDFRRIKTAMENIGWEYGTFRLHDANGKDKRPRKGFARGNETQRKREEIAENIGSGVGLYVLDESGTKTPF
ncbi:VapE domain-containing protein, partial [Maritalea sp.]|uniref:VapE domain-containing protein n=1 Tax=Maritalea sp. TaxID=2003361 RepID=UPI003EFA9644